MRRVRGGGRRVPGREELDFFVPAQGQRGWLGHVSAGGGEGARGSTGEISGHLEAARGGAGERA